MKVILDALAHHAAVPQDLYSDILTYCWGSHVDGNIRYNWENLLDDLIVSAPLFYLRHDFRRGSLGVVHEFDVIMIALETTPKQRKATKIPRLLKIPPVTFFVNWNSSSQSDLLSLQKIQVMKIRSKENTI